VKQLVSVGESPGGNGELLQKILETSPAAVAAEFVRDGRLTEVYKVLKPTPYTLHPEPQTPNSKPRTPNPKS
jgi:hypothetical protein